MGPATMTSGPPRHSLMRGLRWASYKGRLLLLGLFGPAHLHHEHDPIVRLKREHGQKPRDGGHWS
jgi:hypothetical protein